MKAGGSARPEKKEAVTWSSTARFWHNKHRLVLKIDPKIKENKTFVQKNQPKR